MLTWQVTYAPRAPTAPLVAAGLRGGGDVPAPPIGQPSDRSIGAQSRLQIRERCWRRRRSQRRRQQLPLLSNAPRSDAGVLGPPWTTKAPPGARRPVRWHPLRAAPAGAPTTAVAPPLMEGRSAPLPPRRRWERHWWWPGRPSAAARRARAAVAACAAPASSGRPRFERAPPASSGRPGRVPRFERGDAAWDSLSEMSASKGETPNLISESLKYASKTLDFTCRICSPVFANTEAQIDA